MGKHDRQNGPIMYQEWTQAATPKGEVQTSDSSTYITDIGSYPQREKSKRLIHPHTQTHWKSSTNSHITSQNTLHSNCRDNIQYDMRYIHCDTALKIWRTTWRLRDLLGDRMLLNEEPLQVVLCNSQSNVEEHLLAAGMSNPTEQ